MTRARSRTTAFFMAAALVFGLAGTSVVMSGAPANAALPKCQQAIDNYYLNWYGPWGQVPGIDNAWVKTESCYLNYGTWNNDAVQALQRSLKYCYGRGIALDGDFGSATRSALRYAQGREGIAVDGVYGQQSHDNLRWYIAAKRGCYTADRLVW